MTPDGTVGAVSSEPVTRRVKGVSRTESVVLTAAIEAFSERGFHGASMRYIAGLAGTSLSNLYNYVQTKSDLLVRILQQASSEQLVRVQEAVTAAEPFAAARLVAGVEAFADYVIEHRTELVISNAEFRYLEDEHRRAVVESRDAIEQIVGQIVVEGVRSGAFATPFPHEATRSLLTMLANITVWFRPGGQLSGHEIARRHGRLALALVEARGLEHPGF